MLTRFFHVLAVFLLVVGVFFSAILPTRAVESMPTSLSTDTVVVTAFVREGCQHCADEEAFFATYLATQPKVAIKYYRLENPEDKALWLAFTERTGTSRVTPLTLVGDNLVIGFDKAETTGEQLKQLITQVQASGRAELLQPDLATIQLNSLSRPLEAATCPEDGSVPCAVPGATTRQPLFVSIPFIGQLDVQAYPLIALSAVLGLIDGFNPCAMWVLVTFSLLLLQVGSRRKMAVFIGTFVLAEAIMYYLIMTVWFKTWDFVQLDGIVTPIIGLVALGSGAFFLYEWRKETTECVVTDLDQRQKIRSRIKELATQPFTILTFFGILGLAFSVNVIEFACSIGIPQTFTKILELNNLSWLSSQAYLALYILMYMIDDFIVFGIALLAIDKLHLTSKYSKISNFVGGTLMIILGLLLIFRREWLML